MRRLHTTIKTPYVPATLAASVVRYLYGTTDTEALNARFYADSRALDSHLALYATMHHDAIHITLLPVAIHHNRSNINSLASYLLSISHE